MDRSRHLAGGPNCPQECLEHATEANLNGTGSVQAGVHSPEPRVSDEAVEAAAKALRDEGGDPGHNIHSWRCEHPDRFGECDCVKETARIMLAAAKPYMGATPVAARDAVTEVLHRERHFGRKCEKDEARDCLHYREAWRDVDVLLAAGVFREPLTREQISEALLAAWIVQSELKIEASPVEHCRALADAILALLGGEQAKNGGEAIAALEDEWRQSRPEYQAGLFVAIKKLRELGGVS